MLWTVLAGATLWNTDGFSPRPLVLDVNRGTEPHKRRIELDRELRRLDKLMELYYADAIIVHEFKVRRDDADEHVRKLQVRCDESVARDVGASEVACRISEVISMLRDKGISAEQKNAVLTALVERIEYFKHDRAQVNRDIELRVKRRGL